MDDDMKREKDVGVLGLEMKIVLKFEEDVKCFR